MPFKSKAQLKKFRQLVKKGEISQATFNKWLDETPNITKLPERAKSKKSKGRVLKRKNKKNR